MSLRIATVQAEIEAAYQALTTLSPAQSLQVKAALDVVEQEMAIYRRFSTHTDTFTATFSTVQIMARFIKMCRSSAPDIQPAKLLKHRLVREMEPNVVAMHRMWMHVAMFNIQMVQRNMQPPPSLAADDGNESPSPTAAEETEPPLSPLHQGYLHDKKRIGPEYTRFATHKTALDGLTALVKSQRAKASSPSLPNPSPQQCWSRNLKQLGGKLERWGKEMEWVDVAFKDGDDPQIGGGRE
ncbi:MAG: hypothetical protein L6R36_000872 [Xanthoria steineri]|nr:MAG: hypothetical protein L6R36_000872 [Xanthoria steineri]